MSERITKPYIRINGKLTEASFEETFQYICQKLQKPEVNSTLAMSSGSYSNETLYLLQRLTRTVLNTNALDAFDYYRRGTDFFADKNDILPFAEMFSSDKFYCMFPDVNFYLIHHHLEKGIYVEALGKNYGPYKQALMADDYEALLRKNDLQDSDIKLFVEDLLTVPAPAFIVWERWLTEKAYHELENLCMLLDVQSKPAAGFITIKGELNSQGLFDMGMFPHIAPGGHTMDDSMRQKMEAVLGTAVCATPVDVAATLDCGGFRNVLIWNALNVELPKDVVNQLDKAEFSVLHSAYMPDNADLYSVILPANLPEELSGTYTDTAKVPHQYVSENDNMLEYNNLQQIAKLAEAFGCAPFPQTPDEVFLEYISFMEAGCHSAERHFFR